MSSSIVRVKSLSINENNYSNNYAFRDYYWHSTKKATEVNKGPGFARVVGGTSIVATLPLFSKDVVFMTQTLDLLVTKEQHISFAPRFAHYYWHSTIGKFLFFICYFF